MLRGEYPFAELRSDLGRIDLQQPPGAARTEVDVRSAQGEVYLDLRRDQQFDLLFAGDQKLVYCDPEVRLDWRMNVPLDGEEFVSGVIGDLRAPVSGRLKISVHGAVRVRLLPAVGG
jgi:hypothetical protein